MPRLLSLFLYFGVFGFLIFPGMVRGGEVKLTEKGFLINAGPAGVYTLSYPKLLTPNDQGLKPEKVKINTNGSSVTMTYTPSGKLAINRQADGSWLFNLTEIPPDRVKFGFSTSFPVSVADEGATWSFNDEAFKPFPAIKGEVRLRIANPDKFTFKKNGSGFVITYPHTTFNMFTDQRSWGKPIFGLGMILYFPGKKHVPEKIYSLRIDTIPANPDPAPKPKS